MGFQKPPGIGHGGFRAPKPSGGGGGGGNTYTAAVLVDAPVAYYRLGEGGAGPAVDQMSGPNGTYSGATAAGANLLPTAAGASTSFTGGQIAVPDSTPTEIGAGDFSIETWLTLTAVPNYQALVDSANRAITQFVHPTVPDLYGFYGGTNATPVLASALTSAPTHLVITVQGTILYSYVNSVAFGPQTVGHGTTALAGFTIGGNPSTGGVPWAGRMQEFALYNKALSAARVLAHYQAG